VAYFRDELVFRGILPDRLLHSDARSGDGQIRERSRQRDTGADAEVPALPRHDEPVKDVSTVASEQASANLLDGRLLVEQKSGRLEAVDNRTGESGDHARTAATVVRGSEPVQQPQGSPVGIDHRLCEEIGFVREKLGDVATPCVASHRGYRIRDEPHSQESGGGVDIVGRVKRHVAGVR